MRGLKLSFAFLLMFLLVGMFSAVAFAAGSNPVVTPPGDPADVKAGVVTSDSANDNNYDGTVKSNVNKTGTGVGTNDGSTFGDVIKSDDMIKADGTKGTHRTHGDYMNNTNSCASCHQTHTGAAANLLFKNGEYATCTACHDGTLGFYNVFTGSDSAGTFGGTHDGNMSVHLANGTVGVKAAPGGKSAGGGEWEAEFTCASCHGPHGTFSDRLLHANPNHMGNLKAEEGGKRLEGVPVVTDITAKVATADYTFSTASGDKTINYVFYKSVLGTTPDSVYTAKGLASGDTVIQLKKWDAAAGAKDANGDPLGAYVNDTDPWLHGYDFDADHVKHYWTAFQNAAGSDQFHTDMLKSGVIYGNGFAGVKSTNTTVLTKVNSLVKGNVARGYVVDLDVNTLNVNNVATTNVWNLWASKLASGATNPNYIKGRGAAMSAFCSACHTDYLAESGEKTGTFDHAYRHTTTSDSYTCVRCHYAHGTDVTMMRDALGKTYDQILADATNYPFVGASDRATAVKDYLIDKNPSSALKRYTNMAVCWGCHTSSHSEGTRNASSYQYNSTPGIASDRNGIEFDY